MNTDEVIRFFEEQQHRPLSRWHTAAWIYFALGGPVLLGFICRASHVYEPATGWALSATVVLFCALNFYLMLMFGLNLYATRYAPGRMARSLREKKNDITWLYIETFTTYYLPDPPDPQSVLHFHFTDRKAGSVCASQETITQLMNYFDSQFPDVSLGYEPKLAWRSFFNPGSLKTIPVRHRIARKTVFTAVSADY